MPKIRRKSIENDFLLIFFCMQSEGVAQSSILMILRHPLCLFLFPAAKGKMFYVHKLCKLLLRDMVLFTIGLQF